MGTCNKYWLLSTLSFEMFRLDTLKIPNNSDNPKSNPINQERTAGDQNILVEVSAEVNKQNVK